MKVNLITKQRQTLYKNKRVHPLNCITLHLVRIARKVYGVIHWMDLYPKDSGIYFVNIYHWIEIYPVDRVDQPLNNWGTKF